MVKDALVHIKARIARACDRAGRDPLSVTLIGVTKGRPLSDVREAVDAGITEIGESRVQEALLKYNELLHPNQSDGLVYPSGLYWHMIGHLQTNKVKDAVRIFDLIQSVDSLRLAEAISKEAARLNKVQDILLEIKTSSEATKFGASPEEAAVLLAGAGQLDAIRIKGLMTIAPAVEEPEKARIYFRQLKNILDSHNARCPEALRLRELSMGMSDDFEVAVEEGATMVRIGRALFG